MIPIRNYSLYDEPLRANHHLTSVTMNTKMVEAVRITNVGPQLYLFIRKFVFDTLRGLYE